jgi:hypothetical protein
LSCRVTGNQHNEYHSANGEAQHWMVA